ncbi:MAG: hypothetical protein OQL19_13045 [Gammaproteobacteria bacterium]|nr:hypothetical protein [Gammaproteobacteria bacterium]
MKTSNIFTLKRILTSALFASFAISGSVQADQWDNELYNIIHPESADIFNIGESKSSTEQGIVSLHDDHNKNSVWSYEFEQYVNPADFGASALTDAHDVNRYMGSNPTAAGGSTREVFIYNENGGEYHLQ